MLDNKTLRIEPYGKMRERALFLHNGLWVTVKVFAKENAIRENTLRCRLENARRSPFNVSAHDLLNGPVQENFSTCLPWVRGYRSGKGGADEYVRYRVRDDQGVWKALSQVARENRWASPRMLRARIHRMLDAGYGSWSDLMRRREGPKDEGGTTVGIVVEDIPWPRTVDHRGPCQPWTHLIARGL